MFLSIVQVAARRAVADRVWSRFEQVRQRAPRAAREVGLALQRGRADLTHAAVATLGPMDEAAGEAQAASIVALESGRSVPLVDAEDGACLLTALVSSPRPIVPAAGAGLEPMLAALAALADGDVSAFRLVRFPADPSLAADVTALAQALPHLAALDPAALSGQSPCRFCGTLQPSSATRCAGCGGDVRI